MSDKFSFSKKVRLYKKAQFQTQLTQRSSLAGRYFVFYYGLNGLAFPRLGIITPKKKLRLAVLRNRVKRQVRESFRHVQSRLPAYDIVVVARHEAGGADQCELRRCLDNLFLKL